MFVVILRLAIDVDGKSDYDILSHNHSLIYKAAQST